MATETNGIVNRMESVKPIVRKDAAKRCNLVRIADIAKSVDRVASSKSHKFLVQTADGPVNFTVKGFCPTIATEDIQATALACDVTISLPPQGENEDGFIDKGRTATVKAGVLAGNRVLELAGRADEIDVSTDHKAE